MWAMKLAVFSRPAIEGLSSGQEALNRRAAEIAASVLAMLLAGCASSPAQRELHGEGLGSTWKVTLASGQRIDVPTVKRGIQQQVDEVANQLSRWDATSALSMLNAAEDSDWHPL